MLSYLGYMCLDVTSSQCLCIYGHYEEGVESYVWYDVQGNWSTVLLSTQQRKRRWQSYGWSSLAFQQRHSGSSLSTTKCTTFSNDLQFSILLDSNLWPAYGRSIPRGSTKYKLSFGNRFISRRGIYLYNLHQWPSLQYLFGFKSMTCLWKVDPWRFYEILALAWEPFYQYMRNVVVQPSAMTFTSVSFWFQICDLLMEVWSL